MAFTTLKPGTFLYRGTKGKEDPYDKGVSQCFMAYFGRDIYTAANYAEPKGEKKKLTTKNFIWKYKVLKPIILLNLRDNDRMVFSNMNLNLLKRVFQDFAKKLRIEEESREEYCLDDEESDDENDKQNTNFIATQKSISKNVLQRAYANFSGLNELDLEKNKLEKAYVNTAALELQDRLKWNGYYDTIVDFDQVQEEMQHNMKGGNNDCSPSGDIWKNVWEDSKIVSCDVLKAAQAFGIDDTSKKGEYYRSSNIIYDHYFLMLLFGSQLGLDFRKKNKEMIRKSIPKTDNNSTGNIDNDKERKINSILEMCDRFIGYCAHPWPTGTTSKNGTKQIFHEEVCFQKIEGLIECVGKCKFETGELKEYDCSEMQIAGGKRKYKRRAKSQRGGEPRTFEHYFNRIVSNEDIPKTDGYEIVNRSGNVPENTNLIIF